MKKSSRIEKKPRRNAKSKSAMKRRHFRHFTSKNAIEHLYDRKWVVLRNPKYDEDGNLILAEVVASSVNHARLMRRVRMTVRSPLIVKWVTRTERDPNIILIPSVWRLVDPSSMIGNDEQ